MVCYQLQNQGIHPLIYSIIYYIPTMDSKPCAKNKNKEEAWFCPSGVSLTNKGKPMQGHEAGDS